MQSNGGDSTQKAAEQSNYRPAAAVQQQQQWMAAMQYPAAAMVMQHQMMQPSLHQAHYGGHIPPMPPHYMAYHHQALNHGGAYYQGYIGGGGGGGVSGGSGNGENKTLWVGDLFHWMDENYLNNCFASSGEIVSIKLIRNRQTGVSEGYGFVEFSSHTVAEKVLQDYSGACMPNTDQQFRLNWASCSGGDKRQDATSDLSIFVGDLAVDVNDTALLEVFSKRYPSVKSAKVVLDTTSGRSKGYGFVRFGDEAERSQAMTEMNGVYCSSRAMRIGPATPRKSSGYQHGGHGSNGAPGQGYQPEGDSSNTTIFVGGLDPNVTDEELRQPFADYGEIVSVKIPSGKGCGFVQFANRSSAEEALQKLNGAVIGSQTVRLSWGRNPANKQFRGDYGNQWGGPSYYGPYDGYGYAAPPYGSYPVYGSQQVN